MPAHVVATGVLIRLATEAETQAAELARRGHGFSPEPSRSHRFTTPERPLDRDEVYVVSQTFVDFTDDAGEQRWVSFEHHGLQVSTSRDATLALLQLARETAEEGLVDLLGDMGIAQLGIGRWELMSAPHRIERAPGLEKRLAPLSRR